MPETKIHDFDELKEKAEAMWSHLKSEGEDDVKKVETKVMGAPEASKPEPSTEGVETK